MNTKYYDLILAVVQILLVIAKLNIDNSDFAEALIVIVQAILLFMQCTMRPDGCDDK